MDFDSIKLLFRLKSKLKRHSGKKSKHPPHNRFHFECSDAGRTVLDTTGINFSNKRIFEWHLCHVVFSSRSQKNPTFGVRAFGLKWLRSGILLPLFRKALNPALAWCTCLCGTFCIPDQTSGFLVSFARVLDKRRRRLNVLLINASG